MIPASVLLPAEGWHFLAVNAAAAIVVVDGNNILMQHRDAFEGLIYPGHWGLFGGAINEGEAAADALRRELYEELRLEIDEPEYFTAVDYDFDFCAKGWTRRRYYIVHITQDDLPNLELREGDGMKAFRFPDILAEEKVVPFDAWALWMYVNRKALAE